MVPGSVCGGASAEEIGKTCQKKKYEQKKLDLDHQKMKDLLFLYLIAVPMKKFNHTQRGLVVIMVDVFISNSISETKL